MRITEIINESIKFILKNPSFLLPFIFYYLLTSFVFLSLEIYQFYSLFFFFIFSLLFLPFIIYSLIHKLEKNEYTFSVPRKIFKDLIFATILKLLLFLLFFFFISLSIFSIYFKNLNLEFIFIFSIIPLFFLIRFLTLEVDVSTKKLNFLEAIKHSFKKTKGMELKIFFAFIVFFLISLSFLIISYYILDLLKMRIVSYLFDSFSASIFFSSLIVFSYKLNKSKF